MEINFQSGDNTTLEGLQSIVNNQEKQIAILQTTIEELTCTLIAKNSDISNIGNNRLELQQLISKQENEITALKSTLDELTSSLKKEAFSKSVPELEASQNTIKTLEGTTTDLLYENKCLRACLLPISPFAENAALLELEVKTNVNLRKEIEELKKKFEDQKFWNIENSETYQDLRRQCNELEDKNEEQIYTITELLESEKKLTRLENEMSALYAKHQNTLQRNSMLESEMKQQLNQYREMIKETENDNFVLKERLREAVCSVNVNAADKILYLEQRVNELNEDKCKLENRLKSDREKLGTILERLENNINQNKRQKQMLLTDIDKFQLRICELEGLNKILEIKLGETNRMLQGVTNNKITKLENEKCMLQTDLMILEERVQAFNKQHDDIVDQIKGCAMKQIETESEVIQMHAKLNKEINTSKQLEYQLNEARKYINELKQEASHKCANLDKSINELHAKNNILLKERDLVVCENNELTLRIADYQKSASKLRTVCTRLDSTVKDNTALSMELEVIKKQYHGKITNAKIIIQTLKSENEALKTQVDDLIKTMKVEDNIDLLVKDRMLEKKTLYEKIQKLEVSFQELEFKNIKYQEELKNQSDTYRMKFDHLQIEKNTEIQNLQEEYTKNLALAKLQYDKDIEFVHGRHNESIVKLQDMHEDGIKDKTEEHATEIEDIKAQKQAYRDALRTKRREVEELRDQLTALQNDHNQQIEDMKKIFDADRKRSTENISKLAKKCWIELEKIKIVEKENQYMKEKTEKENVISEKSSEMIERAQIIENELQRLNDKSETQSCSNTLTERSELISDRIFASSEIQIN